MPIYTFICPNCKKTDKKLMLNRDAETTCSDCGKPQDRQIPSEVTTVTYEMRDPYRGKQLPKNHEAKMRKRMRDHHDKYEVAKKIEEHGMEDAIKFGWAEKNKKKQL